MRRLLCLMGALLALTFSAYAQEPEEVPQDVGEVLASVEIAPGIYILGADTDLLEMLGIEPLGSITNQYGVGTTNINIFGPVVSKLPYGVHYVYWREGQYDYKIAFSETLVLNGTTFSSPRVTVVTYNTNTSGSSQATFRTTTETNFTLPAGNFLVWSDLGNYPTLNDREGVNHAKLTNIILCSGIIFVLFYRMWASARQRYINP